MSVQKERLKAIRFEKPDYIPMRFHINDACWTHYDQDFLFDLMEKHAFLFPDFVRKDGKYLPKYDLVARVKEPFMDDFSCLWETSMDGITGTVTKHPIQAWSDFNDFKAPDPETCMGIGPVDWVLEAERVKREKETNGFAQASLRHGHTFLQLCDIRGYQNLIFDMYDDHPDLYALIDMIESFNMQLVNKYVDLGVDMMGYPEDLGMQKGPMISPELFRKFIKPSYKRLIGVAKDKGVAIHMHSDGDLHDLIDDLIEGGVEAINLQDLVNGVDWIADKFAGKVCVDLDIDRQATTPYGTREEIDQLIGNEVKKIGSKQGGLMMTYGLYPGVKVENIEYIMAAMVKWAQFY